MKAIKIILSIIVLSFMGLELHSGQDIPAGTLPFWAAVPDAASWLGFKICCLRGKEL